MRNPSCSRPVRPLSSVAAVALVAWVVAAVPAAALAQDAIGVTFQGQVLRLDTATGAVSVLASGTAGKNCLTFDTDNRLWTVVRPIATQSVWRLARIDPLTGAETLPFPAVNVGDLRAMCIARFVGGLYAIREHAPTDELVHIDTDTGVVTSMGFCNHAAIQGLEDPFGGAKAWDVNAGMLQVDLSTGFTNDPFLGVVDPPGLQFLCRDGETNERYVGRGSLYRLDTGTGTTTLVTNFAGNPDLRGMEFTGSRRENFGSACAPAGAPNPFLSVSLPVIAGSALQTQTAVGSGALGALVVGLSEDSVGAVPLPLALDPLFGTNGCELLVSADLLVVGAEAQGFLSLGFAWPAAAAFQQIYVQSVVFAPTTNAWRLSQGVRVRSRLL
jgi:hypothetical protein